MTSYTTTIAKWADVDTEALAAIEREADTAQAATPGMHDTRVNLIVSNAFNGLGDSTGSDDYGTSVAWIDLADHIEFQYSEVPAGVDYWNVGAYLATWRDMAGCRYGLAYIDANGIRNAVGYETNDDMMSAYRELEAEFLAWEGSEDELQHVDYPHEHGRLYDCAACEAECHCQPGETECIFDGEHNGSAVKVWTWEEAWDYLIEFGVSEEALILITSINGTSLETMESVLYSRFGYRSFDQLEN